VYCDAIVVLKKAMDKQTRRTRREKHSMQSMIRRLGLLVVSCIWHDPSHCIACIASLLWRGLSSLAECGT